MKGKTAIVQQLGLIIHDYSLQSAVYRQILGAITSLKLAPDQRLVEARIAEQLGVSRPPVREAIRQLEREQLVVVRPRRRAVVAPLTTRDAEEVYALRIRLETLAAFLAAENSSGEQIRGMEYTLDAEEREIAGGDDTALFRRGAEFHARIVVAGGNRKLEEMLRMIGHHVARLRALQGRSAPAESVESAHLKHREILKAIARREAWPAERLMDEHIRVARDRIVRLLRSAEHADRVHESLLRLRGAPTIKTAAAGPPFTETKKPPSNPKVVAPGAGTGWRINRLPDKSGTGRSD